MLQEHGLLVREGTAFWPYQKMVLILRDISPRTKAIGRQMQEQFTDRAVAVLCRSGLHAWRNSADHVAVGPQAPGASESGTD